MVSGGSKTLCAYMSCRQWQFQTRFTGGTSVLFFNQGTEQKKKTIFLNVLSTYCTGLTVSVSDPSFFASSPANSSVSLSSPHDLHPLSTLFFVNRVKTHQLNGSKFKRASVQHPKQSMLNNSAFKFQLPWATAYHHKKSINYYLLSTEARASSTGALAPVGPCLKPPMHVGSTTFVT